MVDVSDVEVVSVVDVSAVVVESDVESDVESVVEVVAEVVVAVSSSPGGQAARARRRREEQAVVRMLVFLRKLRATVIIRGCG